jgi:hypothetical protein
MVLEIPLFIFASSFFIVFVSFMVTTKAFKKQASTFSGIHLSVEFDCPHKVPACFLLVSPCN